MVMNTGTTSTEYVRQVFLRVLNLKQTVAVPFDTKGEATQFRMKGYAVKKTERRQRQKETGRVDAESQFDMLMLRIVENQFDPGKWLVLIEPTLHTVIRLLDPVTGKPFEETESQGVSLDDIDLEGETK